METKVIKIMVLWSFYCRSIALLMFLVKSVPTVNESIDVDVHRVVSIYDGVLVN